MGAAWLAGGAMCAAAGTGDLAAVLTAVAASATATTILVLLHRTAAQYGARFGAVDPLVGEADDSTLAWLRRPDESRDLEELERLMRPTPEDVRSVRRSFGTRPFEIPALTLVFTFAAPLLAGAVGAALAGTTKLGAVRLSAGVFAAAFVGAGLDAVADALRTAGRAEILREIASTETVLGRFDRSDIDGQETFRVAEDGSASVVHDVLPRASQKLLAGPDGWRAGDLGADVPLLFSAAVCTAQVTAGAVVGA